MLERVHGIVSRDVLTAEPGLAFLRSMLEGRHPAPPFSRATHVYMTHVEEGRVIFEGEPTEAFFNPLGTIHGGSLFEPAHVASSAWISRAYAPAFAISEVWVPRSTTLPRSSTIGRSPICARINAAKMPHGPKPTTIGRLSAGQSGGAWPTKR